jgi:hypothetical protein
MTPAAMGADAVVPVWDEVQVQTNGTHLKD